MNKTEICGICSDYQRGMRAFKRGMGWGLVATHHFKLTDDDNNVYDVRVDDDCAEWDIKNGAHLYAEGVLENGVLNATYVDRWGRYCSHCGKHHEEGYWINEHEYACSDECAIAILGGKEQFDEAMNEYEDDADYNPICWVEWYN